jgi:superfamily II DNA or RNA helicase
MYELRPYQKETIDTIKNMNYGEIGLISLPTASGKGVILSTLASQIEGRTLIILPSRELREDMISKLKSIDEDIDAGSVQANLDEVSCKIVVCTRQSLTHKKSTRIDRMLEYGNFELVFMDECHQAVSQLKNILDKLDISKTKVVGLTATPFNEKMKEVFPQINYSKDILWMIENKYLCEPKAYTIETTTDITGVKTVAGEFHQRELEDAINNSERNDLIVKGYLDYAKDRNHTLVFCSGIDHSRDLCEEFNRQGIPCKAVDSTLSAEDRADILNDFKNGKIKVITNVAVLTTGYDFAPLDCIIFASPTKSKIKYVQCLGRALRLHDTKENALVLDFKDVTGRHNLMDLGSIFDVEMKNGETLSEAQEREQNEVEEEKLRKEQERIKREEEKRKIEEMIAKERELFNLNLEDTFDKNAYFDWFKINYKMFAVSESGDIHYVILKDGNNFNTYKVCTIKGEQSANELDIFDNVLDAIRYIEEENITDARSYAYRNVKWKKEQPTVNQLKYIKNKYSVKTKWDVHIYFKNWLIKKIIENTNN